MRGVRGVRGAMNEYSKCWTGKRVMIKEKKAEIAERIKENFGFLPGQTAYIGKMQSVAAEIWHELTP